MAQIMEHKPSKWLRSVRHGPTAVLESGIKSSGTPPR